MFVRVFDKDKKRYYKSIVYGLVNIGYYEQAILYNPYTDCFELIDYLDKESKELRPLYECINSADEGWVLYEKTFLLKLKKYCKEQGYQGEVNLYRGYKDAFDDFAFMVEILQRGQIPKKRTVIKVRDNEDIEEWNYIKTQDDADSFMRLIAGFHDATVDKVIYEEDYGKRELRVIVDNSCWYGVVELCFEGLVRMNLWGFAENHSREIYDATLLICDESVFWADDRLETENMDYQGTWIKALNLKWKKLQ